MRSKKTSVALLAILVCFTCIKAHALAITQEADTNAEVQFRAGSDDRIFDPESAILEDPQEDYLVIEPLDGTVGAPVIGGINAATPKSFQIAFVPNLSFGVQSVSTTTQIVPARALSASYEQSTGTVQTGWFQNFAQITDLRGTRTGWNLTVEMTEPFRLLDQTGHVMTTGPDRHDMKGAQLVFRQATHHTVSPKENDLIALAAGVRPAFTLEYDVSARGGQHIMTAPIGSGMGFHTIRWGMQEVAGVTNIHELLAQSAHLPGNERFFIVGKSEVDSPINLVIPGNSMRSGRYRAELTWTLEDGPGNRG